MGVVFRELLYREHDVVDGVTTANRRTGGLQTAVERVGMAVTEGRHQEATVEVDFFHR